MGLFDFLKNSETDKGVAEFKNTDGAVLLDVRTPEEYQSGHIPNSLNIPVGEIIKTPSVIENKDTPLYVYCRSGARSARATEALLEMGYTKVKNIGGILSYHGKVER